MYTLSLALVQKLGLVKSRRSQESSTFNKGLY